MVTMPDENAALMAEVSRLMVELYEQGREFAQARHRIAALEQAIETQRPALDDAHAKIVKYRLEIVELLDQLAKGATCTSRT